MSCISLNNYYIQYSIIFVLNLILLNSICCLHNIVLISGQLVLICLISWIFTKYLQRFLPKEFISSNGKAVFITGCDSGFGNALALKANEYGFRVYATVLDPLSSGSQELVKMSTFSDLMKVIKMDVRNDEEVNYVYEDVNKDLKLNGDQLWAIVNNAGVAAFGHTEWGTLDTYKNVFEVNLFGLVRVTRTFLPLIRSSKGRVVNVASPAGRVTFDNIAVYSMSKHAVISFSDALRREMHKWGVKVSIIEPGGFKTAMAEDSFIIQLFDKIWNETNESVRNDYGLQYFESQKKNFFDFKNAIKLGDLEICVNIMLDAIRNVEPKISYRPFDSAIGRIITTLAIYLPNQWMDQLTNFIDKSKPDKSRV